MRHMRMLPVDVRGEPGEPLLFTANTPGRKRDGVDTATLPWSLRNFKKNPVVLWMHDYRGTRLPIGRANIREIGNNLEAELIFDQGDEFAREVERKYREGFLHAISVGWDDIDRDGLPVKKTRKRAVAHDLLDISAVPMPGDPDALLKREAGSLRSLLHELEGEITMEEPTEEQVSTDEVSAWETASAGMVEVFTVEAHDDDDTRKRAYNALRPTYERNGWTMPEFVETDELSSMDVRTWRGLFLEGETDAMSNRQVAEALGRSMSVGTHVTMNAWASLTPEQIAGLMEMLETWQRETVVQEAAQVIAVVGADAGERADNDAVEFEPDPELNEPQTRSVVDELWDYLKDEEDND